MSSIFPECMVPRSLMLKVVKGMDKVPRSVNKNSAYRFLVFGTEEKQWIALRVVDGFIYFECYASGEGIDISLDGQAAIEVKDFKEIIKRAPQRGKDLLRIGGVLGKKGPQLVIQAGQGSSTGIPLYDPSGVLECFPHIEAEEEIVAIRPRILHECLSRNVIMGMSQHRKSYENFGVLIKKCGDKIRFVTADSNRLVLTEGAWSGQNENLSPELKEKIEAGVLLPVGSIEQVLGVLPAVSKHAMVSLAYSKTKYCDGYTWIVFDNEVVFRINALSPANKFPDHECFIKNKKALSFEFNTALLLDSFRRLKPLADQCVIVLKKDDDHEPYIEVMAIRGSSVFSQEEVSCLHKEGRSVEDLVLTMNIGYMVDAINHIPTKKVRVEFDGIRSPIRVSPVFNEEETVYLDKYIYISMPMELRVSSVQV